MKTGVLLPAAAACLLTGYLGFRMGQVSKLSPPPGTGPVVTQPPDSPTQRGGKPFADAEGLLSPGLRDLLGGGKPDDSAIHGITMKALEEIHPVRRGTAIGLLLESMTPSNAAAIHQAFLDSTIQTGRRHDDEWFMMLKQVGSVMGEASFSMLTSSDSGAAMEGWAMIDPKTARSHFEKLNPNDPALSQMRIGLINGVTFNNPEEGFKLAMAQADAP